MDLLHHWRQAPKQSIVCGGYLLIALVELEAFVKRNMPVVAAAPFGVVLSMKVRMTSSNKHPPLD